MANNRSARIVFGVALLALVALVAAFNLVNLNEAFGSGPPYYGRTTNMDKWSDPLPALAAVDSLCLALVAAYVYYLRRKP